MWLESLAEIMHTKALVLFIVIPATSGFVDCRTACRTCRELKAEQSLLEVHCAMCEECKQRRRDRLQMKSQPTVRRQQLARQASQAQAQPPIQYLQPHYPEGCPTPAPCPASHDELHPEQLKKNGQTCPPMAQCPTPGELQFMNSIINLTQPPVTQSSTPPQYIPPPIGLPAAMPAPLPPPPPPPLAIPMPPMQMPFQYQSVPPATLETATQAPIMNMFLSLSQSSSTSLYQPPSPPPPLPPLPFPPPLPAPRPMPYPPYYPGCYCMPFMGPACHCGPFHQRPDSGTVHDMFPCTTERETISTKEYFYAYVGVPKYIIKD